LYHLLFGLSSLEVSGTFSTPKYFKPIPFG
jgi:hypothetical protein